MFKLTQLNVIARMSIGLIALILSLIFASDFLLNIFPKRDEMDQKVRRQFTQNLAIQLTTLLQVDDSKTINKTIHGVVLNQPQVKSIGIRESNGWLAYASNQHAEHWQKNVSKTPTTEYLKIPIYSNQKQWGDIEVRFESLDNGLVSHIFNRQFFTLAGLAFLATVLIYLYLSRALQYLNPSKAVPNRVNNAFNIIADGILVLDQHGKVVLANTAFKQLHHDQSELYGKKLDEVAITRDLIKALDKAETAWSSTFDDIQFYTIDQDNNRLMLLASCAPVTDDNNASRGFLITLKNITELHETNQKLSETLQALKVSRAKLELNNEQLQEMAFRDSLTGCLNRRAFFQKAEDLYTLALQGNRELYCVMADIDFFKSFNDIYGHYVGDQVIQIVARILTSSLRPNDLVCRYGGEEFCILLTDISQEQALEICERMRSTIEENGNQSLRNQKVKQITASFGIASINAGAKSLENLIDFADSALYISKESGRNQVNQWMSSMSQ